MDQWQMSSTGAGARTRPSLAISNQAGRALLVVAVGGLALQWVVAVLRLPLSSYLRDLNFDDSFYYDVIARNYANGLFSTFDGIGTTNGYHPLWAWLLAPVFGVVKDPAVALKAAKALEFALLAAAAGASMRALWLAGAPLLATAVIPLWLSSHAVFYSGMETSLEVLLLAALLLSLCAVFRDSNRSGGWVGLAAICALLPWARLECVAASVAAAALATLYVRWRGSRNLHAVGALWGCTIGSFLIYLLYNRIAFGMPVPVSGAIKNYWSSLAFAREGGYSLTGNALSFLRSDTGPIKAALLAMAVLAVSWPVPAYRRPGRAASHALDAFVLILVATEAARLAYSILTLNIVYNTAWYSIPGRFLVLLIIPLVLQRLFVLATLLRPASASRIGQWRLAGSALGLLAAAIVSNPWTALAAWRSDSSRDWEIASYEGVLWMNGNLPPGAIVGSADSGVLAYFSSHRVINLDGLVNSKAYFDAMRTQTVENWIRRAGITYFANAVAEDNSDGCAYMALATVQAAPFGGNCAPVFEGQPFETSFRGKTKMRFRVYAWSRSE
jgi:hypothetical protein